MNYSIVKRTIGALLIFESIFFLVPLITAIIYWETAFFAFLVSICICVGLGGLCLLGKNKNPAIYAKEGFVIVALSWIVLSIFGALPFYFSGEIPSFIDALFETVSGFTTTGATILPNGEAIESLPKSLLMWRSFTHWIGGMGVLVFIMAFLPLSGAKNMHMMKAESPGPTVGKLVPKVKETAKILYIIYGLMTLAQLILMLIGGMPLFDAVTTAFATAGTGGFSINADSIARYSSYIQIVVTVFMLLFSINFNAYYLIGKGRWKEILTTEIKAFLVIVVSAIALITANLLLTNVADYGYSFGEALKHTAFTVASIISTTGFSTENFDLWPSFSKTILVLLMFIGACAGSTGGGIKVSRAVMLSKGASHEVGRILHPNKVKKITMDKRVVEHEVVRSLNAYIIAYILICIVSVLLISLEGYDMTTNFTSVAATLNNVGPGLSLVGPTGSFAFFSDFSKIVYIFDMLAGRLEIFPMLVLFAPATWRK
ncbi:MAG: TrkH family potassium uptake protein [Clostridiales bacterium]|nr:TrkH family potassium uptake protein [Clostridiales bacterium]